MDFFIIRGIPSTGKSTVAKSIIQHYIKNLGCEPKYCTHVEADQYFVDKDGQYMFDRSVWMK